MTTTEPDGWIVLHDACWGYPAGPGIERHLRARDVVMVSPRQIRNDRVYNDPTAEFTSSILIRGVTHNISDGQNFAVGGVYIEVWESPDEVLAIVKNAERPSANSPLPPPKAA